MQQQSMEPKRISPIYCRDIFSYLPRKKIEEFRSASRIYNSRIISMPMDKLPRRRFGRLTLMATNPRPSNCPINPNVFDCDEEDDCARLKDESKKLIGQLVFPNLPATARAVLCIERNINEIEIEVPNLLSGDEEVFHLTHFLHHLRSTAFGKITSHHAFFPSGTQPHPLLNSIIIELLDSQHGFPRYKLFAWEYRKFPDHSPMSFTELTSVRKWINFRRTLSYCRPESIAEALDLITDAGGRRSATRNVHLSARDFTITDVETIIMHLNKLEPSKWKDVVSEATFDFYPHLPPTLPPCCSMQRKMMSWTGRRVLHFNFVNDTGRIYRSLRVMIYINSRSEIEKMRLLKMAP